MQHPCFPESRRSFLQSTGLSFASLVAGAMLHRDGIVRGESNTAWSPPDGTPHFAPKAKNVIWLFMVGGTSHMETFDPKPELNKHAGKTIAESPHKAVLDSPFLKQNLREFIEGNHKIYPKIFPLQVGYRKRGESGIEVSDWWPHLSQCIDDMAVVRSMWTTDNDHGAQLQFHTGRHALEGAFPTIGSWATYGLGSLNRNLPEFVVLGKPLADCCGGMQGHGGSYLGPAQNGVQLNVDPANPLPFASPGPDVYREEQREQFALLDRLNTLAAKKSPEDAAATARIQSYELAFRMQSSIPDVVRFSDETQETQQLYGLDEKNTREFGEQCLAAARMVERGVRFVQIFHGSNGGAGAWDAHSNLKTGHARLCGQTDKPIAGLLKDLKRRGQLDETLVVWATEFGRTPGAERSNGRDHHPYGFSIWMAGGGIKGGVVHGATDPLGFHAVEDRHYVTDVHATVLHQLGLDPRKLVIPGRKRLDIDFGHPIHEIIA